MSPLCVVNVYPMGCQEVIYRLLPIWQRKRSPQRLMKPSLRFGENAEKGRTNMQQLYKLPLMVEPQPEGGYTISCPLLPGLNTEADTLDEVVPNVTDALKAIVELYEE